MSWMGLFPTKGWDTGVPCPIRPISRAARGRLTSRAYVGRLGIGGQNRLAAVTLGATERTRGGNPDAPRHNGAPRAPELSCRVFSGNASVRSLRRMVGRRCSTRQNGDVSAMDGVDSDDLCVLVPAWAACVFMKIGLELQACAPALPVRTATFSSAPSCRSRGRARLRRDPPRA